jgi:hypothetical protein
VAYQNGAIPSSDLTYVQGVITRMYLLTPTATAWKSLVAACKKATGVTLKITSPYGAYRSIAAQQKMWVDRLKYPAGVAYPGLSVHGWGRSVDINNWSSADAWLRENAGRYGFRRTIPNESWHFEHSGGAGAGGVAETDEFIQGEDMPIVVENKEASTRVWSVFDPSFVGATDAERGYLETKDLARARAWVLRYMPGADGAYQWTAANYVAGQVESRRLHEAWKRGISSASPAAGDDGHAELAAEIASRIPAPPTKEEVAAEVMRQQKLEGN